MIAGTVRNREAAVELEVAGAGQHSRRIEAVIDTGYNGYLTLPSQLVTAMQLAFANDALSQGSPQRLNSPMAAPPRLPNCQSTPLGRHSVQRLVRCRSEKAFF